MDALMLIVAIAGETVAFPSAAVESVVEIEAMSPVPLAPAHVAGLAALRSRVVTIIDPRAVLHPTAVADRAETVFPFCAVVVRVDGHPYGIMVDDVVDVLEAEGPARPANGITSAGWRRVATGVVLIADNQYLQIDPALLVEGAVDAAAAR